MKIISQYKNRKNLNLVAISFMVVFFLPSCEKFVEVDLPRTVVSSKSVFEDDVTATAAISKLYGMMLREGLASEGRNGGVNFIGGFSADELVFVSISSSFQDYKQFYNNAVIPKNSVVSSLWGSGYSYIYLSNAIIEGLAASSKITPILKKQLEGEAKFVRAFSHFYLVNLFGDVPLVLTTDYRINAVIPRASKAQVYQQIIADLKDAQNLLTTDYSFSNNERVRPNKGAATALLARVYLYIEDWTNAEIQSTALISNTTQYTLESDVNNVFLVNSFEAIWQLKPDGYNTLQGNGFIPITVPPFLFTITKFSVLSNNLLNTFEVGDTRRSKWVNSVTISGTTYYYPFKYKVRFSSSPPATEYSAVFRLGEQYLIRSEARAQLNNIAGAQSDLNIIRNRAGLANATANDKASLLLAIEHERQVELFTEYGHRWLDLKRTGRINTIIGPLKVDWQNTDALLPIPESEILINRNLTQNPGY